MEKKKVNKKKEGVKSSPLTVRKIVIKKRPKR